MQPLAGNVYAEWRLSGGVLPILHDECDSPPERLLQSIWLHQRLRRDSLKTLNGTPVRVLHPGFLSVEGGPDFRSAVVAIGEGAPVSGDVEIDLQSGGWRAHGHQSNPAFANVVLHVVWDQERATTALPTLALRNVLDAPLGELSQWLATGSQADLPEASRGLCSGELRLWPEERVAELLCQAALVRLRAKASQMQSRARQAGWEQSLWEGVFRALGFKHNVWPMHNLAELKPRWSANVSSPFALEARLLGIAGLLPGELLPANNGGPSYSRILWDQWWRELHEFSDCVFPREVWRFHGIRPANHPQRRVALAAQLAFDSALPTVLERWCAQSLEPKSAASALVAAIQLPESEFWSRHFTLRSASLTRPQPLLGGTRITDMAVNAFIPWLWARAEEGGNRTLQKNLENRYHAWPMAQDNSVLRLARARILGSLDSPALHTAACQQGLLQIVQDWCSHANSLCDGCAFPRLLSGAVA